MKRPGTLSALILALVLAIPAITFPNIVINSISMVSNWKTHDFIILQELSFCSNTNLTQNEFINASKTSDQSLKNLGIFAEVDIVFTTNTNGPALMNGNLPVDLKIKAVDKWTFFPIPYYYYNSSDGHLFGFLLNEQNLFGLAMRFNLSLNYKSAADYKRVGIAYEYPRMFGSQFLTKLNFDYRDFFDAQYLPNSAVQVYRSRSMNFNLQWKTLYFIVNDVTPFSPGLKTTLDSISNRVEMNLIGKVPDNRMNWYILAGAEQGIVNFDSGIFWGDNNGFWFGVSPLDGSMMMTFQHSKYFKVFDRDVIAYRVCGSVTPNWDQPLHTEQLRGILLGEVRGNYIFYANAEYRKFILTIPWPTVLDFYIPLFVDAGNGFLNGASFDAGRTMVTAGLGFHFYPRYLGGRNSALCIDIGFSLSKMLKPAQFSFNDYFYFGVDFSETF